MRPGTLAVRSSQTRPDFAERSQQGWPCITPHGLPCMDSVSHAQTTSSKRASQTPPAALSGQVGTGYRCIQHYAGAGTDREWQGPARRRVR